MNVDFLTYGFKQSYNITKGSDASEFLESEFRKYFNYKQHSKRQKYADVWITPKLGFNLKTSCAEHTTGRICTTDVANFLIDIECNLKIIHLDYKNVNGQLKLNYLSEYYIEEIEYNITNQGRGLIQPKVSYKDNSLKTRTRLSREDWLSEFKIKYNTYCENQKKRLDLQNEKMQNLKVKYARFI